MEFLEFGHRLCAAECLLGLFYFILLHDLFKCGVFHGWQEPRSTCGDTLHDPNRALRPPLLVARG